MVGSDLKPKDRQSKGETMKTAIATDDTKPTVTNVKRWNGVAGNYAYSATVQYPGEPAVPVVFYGSAYGEPGVIVMGTAYGWTFVADPGRFGPRLTADWVRAFFA